MSLPSLIFWAIFVLPFIGFMVWIMRQDKRRSKTGLFVLAVLVIVAVVYMYLKTGGK